MTWLQINWMLWLQILESHWSTTNSQWHNSKIILQFLSPFQNFDLFKSSIFAPGDLPVILEVARSSANMNELISAEESELLQFTAEFSSIFEDSERATITCTAPQTPGKPNRPPMWRLSETLRWVCRPSIVLVASHTFRSFAIRRWVLHACLWKPSSQSSLF